MGTTVRLKWVGFAILMIIISSNLVLSEDESLNTSNETGRRLLQTQDSFNTRYKADALTRVDPLDHFNQYRGGYNITNTHYWSSTIFTGIYGFAVGLLWIIAGILYAVYLLIASCCENKNQQPKRRTPCQKPCYLFSLILTTVLAILAIIASGVALEGNIQFHSKAKTIMRVIINTADQASNTIYNATGPMRKIGENLQLQATNSIDSIDGTSTANIAAAASFLASTSDKLDYAATGIQKQAEKNRELVEKGLTIFYILTIITISLNLAAMISLTVFGILKFQRAQRMLIIICWLLTSLCWLFFGAYFFLEKFSSDTCTALQDFRRNPDNSSLSSILPCEEFLSASTALSDIGIGIYEMVDQVNTNITLQRSNSFPGLPYLCNPFSGPPDYSYQPEHCASDTIKIGDIPQVLKLFTCSDTSQTNCQGGGLVTTSEYNAIEAYSTSIQSLLNSYPDMESLVDCQLVKHASSEILIKHCKPLKSYVQTTKVALLVLSVVMVFLVPLWASTSHHEQKHHFADGSVQPKTTPTDNVDLEAPKATIEHQSPSAVI